jgi:hypothetical protein
LLLGGDVIATIIVGWGIIWESPSFPPNRHRIAMWLVIGGVAAETICSISLFAFDESISQVQQAKIIALEERIAPRVVTDAERAAIDSLRGKVSAVAILSSPGLEPAFFSSQMQEAFVEAGMNVDPVPTPVGDDMWMGLQVCWPDDKKAEGVALLQAFKSVEPDSAGQCNFNKTPQDVPTDEPLLIIGERGMFFPNGVPKSLRFRAYPGLAKKRSEIPPASTGEIPSK